MSKKIEIQKQKKADLKKEASGLLDVAAKEERNLNDVEATRFDEIKVSIVECDAQIERLASIQEWELSTEEATAVNNGSQITGGHDRAADKPFASVGEFCASVFKAASGVIEPRLLPQAAATGMGEAVDSDGGYLVPKAQATGLLKRVYEVGSILSRVRKIPISIGNGISLNAIDETSRANGSRMGGVRGYWLDEGDALTASKPKFRKMEMKVKKLGALVYATDELMEDGVALSAVINESVPEELRFKAEDALMNGDGSGKPKGWMNTSGNSPLVSVAKETGQDAATIEYDNVLNMWSRMWARSRANAIWLINQDTEPQLNSMSKVIGTGGVPVYMPANGISGSPYSTLFGRPVIPTEYNATLGTVGDIQLIDPAQYAMIEKGGVKGDSSLHVRFVNNEMAFRFIWRVDGQPIWNSALTPYKGANTLSPFVALATRS
jgi:HK97 family phage major capsid protein